MSSLPYRLGVGVMLLNARGEVFVAQRIDMRTEAWQMPQGGMDEGESPETTAFRELEEEIGTANAQIIAQTENWLTYDLPDELIPKVWGGKYRGQKQHWFLMRFQGDDDEINLETEEPEFFQWKWIPPQQLPDMIVPFKRKLYQDVIQSFASYL